MLPCGQTRLAVLHHASGHVIRQAPSGGADVAPSIDDFLNGRVGRSRCKSVKLSNRVDALYSGLDFLENG